jgi:hypothetical protein
MSPVVCQDSWLACNYQWLIGTVIIPLVAIIAVLATVYVAYRTLQNNNRQATEERQDQARPVVAPSGELSHHATDSSGGVDWGDEYTEPSSPSTTGGPHARRIVPNTQELTLQNMGDGIAFNVHCFLYGPGGRLKPEQNYTSWYNGPIQGKGNSKIIFEHEKTALPEDTKVDDEHVLYDDSEPNVRIARLTITYHDLLGIKHVSIFDYVLYKIVNHTEHKWLYVGTKNGIHFDLYELDNRERQQPLIRKPIK